MSARDGGPLGGRACAWAMNPWARARFLWVIAIAYVVWTLLPVFIAVRVLVQRGQGADHVAGVLAHALVRGRRELGLGGPRRSARRCSRA